MRPTAPSRRQGHWDQRAAGNFIGGGTGAGLIVTAALAAAAGAPFRLPLALGLGFVAAGLTLVWLEIGKPWRALNVFFHPQTSWMTREGILACGLLPVGVLAVAAGNVATAALAGILAAGFAVCQARMLRAAQGIPAWRRSEIVPFVLATALAEGSGLYLAAGAHTAPWLALALAAGLAREATWQVYAAGLARQPAAARSVAAFASGRARLARAGMRAGCVLVAAALAIALGGGLPATAGAVSALAWIGGILAALAGWDIKALLITRAAFTRAVAIPVFPTRGGGGSHVRP
ncbi:MAG TPA: phenylacetyl CoA [Acetobacteraceae bacterium]|nr:phenylacetyl CoA [Acetobacteraceae bacterium]